MSLSIIVSEFILAKKGPLGTIWIAAHLERKLRKNQVADTDIGVSVDSILFPEAPIALRLSSHLLLGVVRIYSKKVNYLFDDCSEALLKVKQAFRSAAVDLPPEESTAPYHSITLPETFDLDDFELPDNEIFQGNYVDHHVSTREQITLQDTMDGVVFSTSQFGLDERFGDGDTAQTALELDEDLFSSSYCLQEVFQDKDIIGSDDEAVQGTDHNAYPDAATPEIKDEIVEVSDAMPRDFNQEQVEDLAVGDEFMEDAQAPQTPGLVEVPNLSSVRDQLACDDHMEVEDPNAEEVRKASGEPDAIEPSEYNAGESAVTPMGVDKSLINENIDAQNDPEERAEHVRITSPCVSHITTEVEDPGQVITETGTDVITDKSDAVPSVESPGEPTMRNAEPKDPVEENQDHFAVTTEANQETDSNLQGDEQLNNAHTTDEQLGDLPGSADTDLPAPEKVLAAPNSLGDENGCLVELESTPDKEDPGTCNGDAGNNITGKKRTFTESTLTAESLNSVESVGLIQSKRTAHSVPDDDDLLSSILVGKSSFLKMRSTPVLEVATTKRLKSAPRSTTTKRKVLMDDPMVLHGDLIREQLTNTEGIRRVRKKAPCTIPEILMLQRQALEEDGLFKEPIFTGMSVELVSLHNEPYDLRGITVIKDDDGHASVVGVVEDNECSVRAGEENEPEERSAPQTHPNDSEEQPAEAQTQPQDQQIVDQDEEGKKDNELGEDICDLEVLKESDDVAGDEANHLVNEEISEVPSEDKIDRVGDLRVEGDHENHDGGNHDGGLGGQDVCDVIEIAEGDVDNNATLNETDLKVEDEDKKTDASAEVIESGIDDQTPCDNTVVEEAGGSSNLASESCKGPLVEESNDGVIPEIESDERYNEMFTEEAYMQSAPDGEPTYGLMRDNDEMDAMEVAHDTGFLNVDDDEVDEDHEDDGVEEGDEARLLENSGWSSRTRAVAKYLQTIFDKEAENGKNVIVADKLLAGKTRKEASRMFFETLVLKTRDYVQVEQAKPYESIIIKPRPKLTKSIF
ncbi:hypothetical protein IGI04_041341 [Brassica rapa subsp. trilocularis]|uniref:Rad21/Rec8-like protein N-terminal domain-containing protein n=1 Tax=Brassica rapa subsp. trilocularis TaxID=1813537 RepID=A0ABQ7KTE5_BRACM|nr:hypothetical protein IGI04_041341 [Brassica rapa subsp. trilocularis]